MNLKQVFELKGFTKNEKYLIYAGSIGLIGFLIYLIVENKKKKFMNLVTEKTYDAKNDEIIAKLHPKMQPLVAKFLNEVYKRKGIKLKIPQSGGLRTFQEQQDLYDKGRTKAGTVVTNAKPGSSYHNYGLAIDVYYLKPDGKVDLKTTIKPEIAEIAKEIGLSWGGYWKSFKDFPHFELNLGKTSELLALKNNGKIDEKGYVIA